MADKKNGGLLQPTPFNETTGGNGPEDYDDSGGGLYGSWDEVQSVHLSMNSADLVDTPNMRSGAGVLGGPAAGEPNPLGYSTTNQSKGSK